MKKYMKKAKGAVSLLLALIMSPLLSISLLLVESARYQSANELMEEIMDNSVFSTLAEYDSYLDERFGLLSVSQETDIQTTSNNYLTENVKSLGKSVTVSSHTSSGKFPLSNTDILKQQLLESGEISVAAEVVTEGIDLEDLLSELEESLNVDEITKEIDAATAGVELAKEIESLLEAIVKAKKQYADKYSPALTDYQNAYADFEAKLVALAGALAAAESNPEENGAIVDIYSNLVVTMALADMHTARDKYKTSASTLHDELSTLKDNISDIFSSLDGLPSKFQDFRNEISPDNLAEDCSTSVYDWLYIIVDQITTTLNATVGSDYKDKIDGELTLLQEQVTKLGVMTDTTVSSSWNADTVKSEYGMVSITTIGSTFGTNMTSLIDLLNQQASIDTAASTKVGNLLDIAGELLGITGLYDSNLNAVVNSSYLHTNTNMAWSSSLSVQSLVDLLDACEEFADGITSLNVIKAVKALGKLLKSIAEFLLAVVTWAGELMVNLITYTVGGPKEWYNGILLYGYGAYNLPNRTNYNSGETLYGYSYNDIYQLGGGINANASLTGSLHDLASLSNTNGSDRMFKGAEVEYILVGSKSELQNQSVTFFDLYLFRMLIDVIPILKDTQVSSIAALAGPAAWVVKLAIVLAEPMLETIILVNGGKEFLFKDTIYLSYSGLVILQNDLVGITALSQGVQDKIKDTIEAHNGTPTEHGKCDASYTEHLLILMFLRIDQQKYMQRMQNLIQMEAAEKHRSAFDFDLDKSYTYIYSDVKYKLNPMLKVDGLNQHNTFTATSQQYLGY